MQNTRVLRQTLGLPKYKSPAFVFKKALPFAKPAKAN